MFILANAEHTLAFLRVNFRNSTQFEKNFEKDPAHINNQLDFRSKLKLK